jgi:ATP-dependent RNA helicase SUPV3L1/SUV3
MISAPAPSEASDGSAPAGEAVAATPEAPATPELIEVWRPGGRPEERRPRHDRNRHRHQGHQPAAQDGAQAATPGEAGSGEKREHHRRNRRNNDFRKPRPDAPVVAAAPADGAPVAEARTDARPDQRNDRRGPPRERFEGKDRDKGDRPNKFAGNRDGNRDGDRNKGDRNKGDRGGRDFGGRDKGGRGDKGGPSHRQWATSAAPRERDRPADPNSPFAKLAALKEQLTAGRKE